MASEDVNPGRVPGNAARHVLRRPARVGHEGVPPVRVVVVGLGFAGTRLLLPALGRLPGVTVVAAADPDPAARAAALRQIPPLEEPSSGGDRRKRRGFTTAEVADPLRSGDGALVVTADWEEAVATPADAVVVATPVEVHAAVAQAALAAGRHVYVEKPLAASAGEATELVAAAARAGCVLQVGHAYRFHPLWRRLRMLVTGGRLVPPLTVRGRFDAVRPVDAGWRHPVVEVGIHHVDLLSWVLGLRPATVEAATGGQLVVGWPDGSRLEGTYAPGPGADRVEVGDAVGRQVVVDRLRGLRLTGAAPWAARLPVPALVRARATGRRWERSFEWALGAFVGAVRSNAPHPDAADPIDGAFGVAFAEAALASLAAGRPTAVVTPVFEGV